MHTGSPRRAQDTFAGAGPPAHARKARPIDRPKGNASGAPATTSEIQWKQPTSMSDATAAAPSHASATPRRQPKNAWRHAAAETVSAVWPEGHMTHTRFISKARRL